MSVSAVRMRASTVDIDGPVFVARYGEEGPPVVLLHGMGASHVHWMAVAPALGRTFRVHAVDLPGCGRTPLLGRAATLEASYRLLRRYLRLLGEPAILVGNSMGALLAMRLAADEWQLVRGLVLVGPAVPWGLSMRNVEPRVALLYSAYYWPGVGEVVRWGRARLLGTEGAVRHTLALCCADPSRVPKAVVSASVDLARDGTILAYENKVYLAAMRSIWPYLFSPGRFAEMVKRIDVPTLLIQGDRDRLVPRRGVDRLAALRPDWRYRVFKDAGHAPQLEAPRPFLKVVRSWLESIETAQPARYASFNGA
jgi:pimeloyl-ACP methyl ester carboxylesterase